VKAGSTNPVGVLTQALTAVLDAPASTIAR
jgi:hypothetical protein